MRLAIPLLGAVLLLGTTSFTLAQQTNTLSDAQITQEVESQGYSNVQIKERDEDHIDVTATKDGQTMELAVNPQTGQVQPDTDNDD